MLSTSTGLPFAITTVSTDQRYRLGELYETWDATYGPRIWRYIKNESGSTLAIGLGAMQEDGTDYWKANLSAANTPKVRMFGVAQHAIVTGSYGFVLAKGIGTAQSDGSTTENTAQIPAASGQFTDWTTGGDVRDTAVCMYALETEDPAGAAGTFDAIIDCL